MTIDPETMQDIYDAVDQTEGQIMALQDVVTDLVRDARGTLEELRQQIIRVGDE